MIDALQLPDRAAWTDWLAEHHATAPDAWLRIRRARSTLPVLAIGDALDGALCHGWIDGLRRGLDEDSFLQRYAPRTARSTWSAINRDRAESLLAAGAMASPGLAAIEAARRDGRWDAAYPPQSSAVVPDDVAAALRDDPEAGRRFETLSRSERYLIMLPVLKATRRRPAALRRMIEQLGGGARS